MNNDLEKKVKSTFLEIQDHEEELRKLLLEEVEKERRTMDQLETELGEFKKTDIF